MAKVVIKKLDLAANDGREASLLAEARVERGSYNWRDRERGMARYTRLLGLS